MSDQSAFEQYVASELARRYVVPASETDASLPAGMAVRTSGIGKQLELAPFPSVGIQGTWDIASDPTAPAGAGPGAIYEVIGANATRDGEDFIAGDLAIFLLDGATTRNMTTFGVAGSPPTGVTIVGDWDISAAADETIPGGALQGYIYRVTPGTYPHVHTSGGGAFVETYNEHDLAIVVDVATPIVRNLTTFAELTGLSSVIKDTWDMDGTGGALPPATDQYDQFRVIGLDYTLGGQLYQADDIALVLETVGPVVVNMSSNVLDDAITSVYRTWSSQNIVDYLTGTFIDDAGTTDVDRVWSIAKVVSELGLKASINDAATSVTEAWSSDKITSYVEAHSLDTTIHFIVDDASTALDRVWSASKLDTEFSAVAAIIDDVAGDGIVDKTWSANKLYNTLEAPLTSHLADADVHRTINDVGSAVTDLWSADQIATYVAANAGAQIDDLAGDTDLLVTWSADKLYNDLVAGHVDITAVHRTINDVGTAVTDLWSADKIGTYVTANAGAQINDSAGLGNTTESYSADKVVTLHESHSTQAAVHRTINDIGSAVTDLWSASKIISAISAGSGVVINDGAINGTDAWSSTKIDDEIGVQVAALINDGVTDPGSVWSSTKVDSEISTAIGAIDHTVLIDDGVTALTTTWSSTEIDSEIGVQVAALIDDVAVSSTIKTWSIDRIVSEISTETLALIDDGGFSASTTWSSSKINTEIFEATSGLLSDGTITTFTTWSSTKIDAEIDTRVEALLDDGLISLDFTWSSTKIDDEIGAQVSDLIDDIAVSSLIKTWSIDRIVHEISVAGFDNTLDRTIEGEWIFDISGNKDHYIVDDPTFASPTKFMGIFDHHADLGPTALVWYNVFTNEQAASGAGFRFYGVHDDDGSQLAIVGAGSTNIITTEDAVGNRATCSTQTEDMTGDDPEEYIVTKKYSDNVRIKIIAGTTYTVLAEDSGFILQFTNAASITLTINTDVEVDGFNFVVEQAAAGEVTFAGTSTRNNVDGHTKTRGLYSVVSFWSGGSSFTFAGATI